MSGRTQNRFSLRIRIGAAIVAVGVVGHPALAQEQTYCSDGSIAVNTTCPVQPSEVPGVPSAPKLTTIAYVSADAVKLTWTAPTSSGASAITAYLATQSVGGVKGQTYRVAANVLTIQLPCVSSMSCGYVVAAENAVGVGPASNYLMASTPAPTVPPPATVPSAPKLATIAYVSANAVKLTWTAPTSNGGSAITAYLATHSVGGVKGQTYRLAANVLTTQLPCVSSTSCGYVIAAENAVGVGPTSNYLVASRSTR